MEQPSSQVDAVAHNEPSFKSTEVKQIIQKVLMEKLQGKVYNSEEAAKWIREITDTVNAEITKSVEMPRYKHVVEVILGQQLGAGSHYMASCFWDAEYDSHTSDVFTNTSLFCICTVFGLYEYLQPQQSTQENTTDLTNKN